MNYERRRTPSSNTSSFSPSSSTNPSSSNTKSAYYRPKRTPSPPASTYFPYLSSTSGAPNSSQTYPANVDQGLHDTGHGGLNGDDSVGLGLGGAGGGIGTAQAYPPYAGESSDLRPTADASSHFAYSTTLRRHHVPHHHLPIPHVQLPPHHHTHPLTSSSGLGLGADLGRSARDEVEYAGKVVRSVGESLWERVMRAVTGSGGREGYSPIPGGAQGAGSGRDEETMSARFAHLSVEDTLSRFPSTSPTAGLPITHISALQATHGYNEFSVGTPDPIWLKFFKNVTESPLILLLVASAFVSGLVGNIDDAISIAVAVTIVTAVGFIQEQRSEKSLEALNKLVPHHCHVIRSDQTHHVLANELVPGDIVTFSTGDRIPADVRIIESVELEIDESSLTGEGEARSKDTRACVPGGHDHQHVNNAAGSSANGALGAHGGNVGNGETALAERSCVAYMGTLVRNGRGKGIVIATGTKTEFGIIFEMMQDVEEKRTPLQLSMDQLAKKLSIISFGVIGVICLFGVLQNRSWLEMFTIGVSLAVAAIPEGLPIVTTVTLALGVLRMSKRKAIVKKLHSVEALGCVSVVCSDKTGTLTEGGLRVVGVWGVGVTGNEVVDVSEGASSSYAGSSSHAGGAYGVPGYAQGYGSNRFAGRETHATTNEQDFHDSVKKTLQVGLLCNNASKRAASAGGGETEYVGQATDVALLEVVERTGAKFGVGVQLRESFTRTSERAFNSETKSMSVTGTHASTSGINASPNTAQDRPITYTKGSLDALLPRCKSYYVSEDSTLPMDDTTRALILERAAGCAGRGLRVLGMAYSHGTGSTPGTLSALGTPKGGSRAASPHPQNSLAAPGSQDTNALPSNLTFVGFQAMYDPPRQGVSEAISVLQRSGVQVVMITGDAEDTALAIGKQLGLRVADHTSTSSQRNKYASWDEKMLSNMINGASSSGAPPERTNGSAAQPRHPSVLTGPEIDKLSTPSLTSLISLNRICIFARTTPRHKMRIVRAYQSLSHIVAMTGDGVNDAPALKLSDIGVSMGSSRATDVAKEAADVILVDDAFGTIAKAVEEGKGIFGNVQNFLAFQLSTACAALGLVCLSTMAGLSNPLNAMQILFINILMDGPPSQSLGVDPVDPAVMRQPPRKKDAPIITKRLIQRILFSASIIIVGTLFVYLFALDDDKMSRREQTMTFTCFVFLDLTSALQNRALSSSLTANKMLLTTVSISFITQLSLIYVPVMQRVFQTEALRVRDLGLLLALAAASFGLHEVRRGAERVRGRLDNVGAIVAGTVGVASGIYGGNEGRYGRAEGAV